MQEVEKAKLQDMVRQGIPEPVQPQRVTNTSPVVWQRKKRLQDLCRQQNSSTSRSKGRRLPIKRHGDNLAQISRSHDLRKIEFSDAFYQIEIDDEAEKCAQSKTKRGCSSYVDYFKD